MLGVGLGHVRRRCSLSLSSRQKKTFNFQPTPPKKHFSLAGTGQKGTLATRSQPFEGDFSPFPFPAALKRGLSVFRFQLQPVRFSRLSAVSGRGISISTLGNGSENGSGLLGEEPLKNQPGRAWLVSRAFLRAGLLLPRSKIMTAEFSVEDH